MSFSGPLMESKPLRDINRYYPEEPPKGINVRAAVSSGFGVPAHIPWHAIWDGKDWTWPEKKLRK